MRDNGTSIIEGSKLRLAFQVDLDEQVNPVLKTKTFSNIKMESTTDQLFQVAQAISGIMHLPAKQNRAQ
ncbi:DUF1659 domain-containing protein [Neobacillus rhizophilus]|uniref:DUF1659 domain-containing protein n=1 Tax=Neobacillus rhizophilus TaxID=2833579 RepID=UPI0027DB04A8|nr:DUF1659 domain-containing protein [Neobacillus rhizophilus]